MDLDADAAYLAFKARDARFDGRLFVGVTSTGVYCRPVCRVRTPMRKNCRFFDTRAQAEAAAFRPCMKCRPEIAPGLSQMDSSRALADTAARWIEHAVHSGDGIEMPALAGRLGVTDRHLRRIFQATHGVTPHAWLTTQRFKDHPFGFYFGEGLRVTLNTDSRLISDTTVSNEILLAARAFRLSPYEVKRIIIMGFKSAFLPYADKARMLRGVSLEIDRIFMEEFPEDYDRRVTSF